MTTNSNRNAFKLNSSLSSFLILLLVFTTSACSDGNYHIIKKIPIPGQGGWDYLIVDDAARRLYASHATQVEVLDVDSGTIAGKYRTPLVSMELRLRPNLAEASSVTGRRQR
jgi:hypothetical protein